MMIRAYKHFRKKLSFIKHEKLTEETGQDPIVEGVTFYVRYLGSCFVINKTGDEATSEAIKSIVSMARKTDRKLNRVALLVSVKDVKMTDLETGDVCFDISIYRVSYCCADALFSHVFAFIAVNKDESMECHAFLCRKRKIAQAASMTVAQAFNLAFASWKDTQEKKKESLQNTKVVNKCDEQQSSIKMTLEMNQTSDREDLEEENLLIDLRSPGDTLDNLFPSNLLVKIDSKDVQEDSYEMDKTFAKLPETPSNVPILKHLPPNASTLDVGAFACGSQTLFDGPLDGLDHGGVDSPLHGSCLTPSQLYTPTCSPHPQIRQVSSSGECNGSAPLSPLLGIHKSNKLS